MKIGNLEAVLKDRFMRKLHPESRYVDSLLYFVEADVETRLGVLQTIRMYWRVKEKIKR